MDTSMQACLKFLSDELIVITVLFGKLILLRIFHLLKRNTKKSRRPGKLKMVRSQKKFRIYTIALNFSLTLAHSSSLFRPHSIS